MPDPKMPEKPIVTPPPQRDLPKREMPKKEEPGRFGREEQQENFPRKDVEREPIKKEEPEGGGLNQ